MREKSSPVSHPAVTRPSVSSLQTFTPNTLVMESWGSGKQKRHEIREWQGRTRTVVSLLTSHHSPCSSISLILSRMAPRIEDRKLKSFRKILTAIKLSAKPIKAKLSKRLFS